MSASKPRSVLFFLFAGLLGVTAAITPVAAHAETKSLVRKRLDTEIVVQLNGDLKITETNVIEFTSGTFSWGFRDIELSRFTDVRDIVVTENGISLETKIGYTKDNKLRIQYYFLTPARNEQRTFVLNYTVIGATRYYDDGDQVYWAAVYADRDGFAVQNARAVVRLPAGATATKAEVYGVRADVRGLGESVVVAEALEPIPSGRQMEVRVQFPHGIIYGKPAAWQQTYDERRRFQETLEPTPSGEQMKVRVQSPHGILDGKPAARQQTYNPAHAETKSLVWKRLDTEIVVQLNGDLKITESNVIEFTSGTFSWGFRDIELSRLTDVRDIVVTENGIPLETEIGYTKDNKLRIKYYFLTPARNEQRTFVLNYTVIGATRYYDDGDQVYWAAVYASRNGFAVQNARSVVRLPAGATATKAKVYGVRADVRGLGESVVVAEALEPIPSGKQMEVRVQFPHGIIYGKPAAWQQAYDERRRFLEARKPSYDLVILIISLVFFSGGPALAVVLYHTRGRDPDVGGVAEYLTEPPKALPGVLGTLIDETADIQDIVATLVHLAQRGVLKIRSYTAWVWALEKGEKFGKLALRPFEQKLVDALQLNQGRRYSSDFHYKFYKNLPELKNALYEEIVREGYYDRPPNTTRFAYRLLATVMAVAAVLALFISIIWLGVLTDYAICLPIALGVTALALFLTAKHMPVRTLKGTYMRKRAEAFKRYLQNIEKYTDITESKDLFDKYLPYAIAFGLNHSWTKKFTDVEAPIPSWCVNVRLTPYYGPGDSGRSKLPLLGNISGQAFAGGGIEGVSQEMESSIKSIEGGLASMFDYMFYILSSNPISDVLYGRRGGGGRGGGGGSGGGSSGGGGGGFG